MCIRGCEGVTRKSGRDKGENELQRGTPFAWKVNEPLQGERNARDSVFVARALDNKHTRAHPHLHTSILSPIYI